MAEVSVAVMVPASVSLPTMVRTARDAPDQNAEQIIVTSTWSVLSVLLMSLSFTL